MPRRQPRGIPTGGQFAPDSKPEAAGTDALVSMPEPWGGIPPLRHPDAGPLADAEPSPWVDDVQQRIAGTDGHPDQIHMVTTPRPAPIGATTSDLAAEQATSYLSRLPAAGDELPSSHEEGFLVGSDGQVTFLTGTEANVSLRAPLDLGLCRGATFLHNHPSRKGLSVDDARVAVDSHMQGIVAVTRDGTYRLDVPEALEETERDLVADAIPAAYSRVTATVRQHINQMPDDDQLAFIDDIATPGTPHAVMRELVDVFPALTYRAEAHHDPTVPPTKADQLLAERYEADEHRFTLRNWADTVWRRGDVRLRHLMQHTLGYTPPGPPIERPDDA